MIVHHMSYEEHERFQVLMDIFTDVRLSLPQRYDKLSDYLGISKITDDSVLRFQETLLRDIMREIQNDIVDAEVEDVELLP
jgi:hypothetical protein